ncbi:MAG: YicC/YloC family endoribonuclease [Bacillota bacterium]|nr:YicC/YloC family endoribonuclease [Bacillota bacterium]
MIKSMTGFGRGIAQNEEYRVSVEMKAVNHRFLEISVRQPKVFSAFEDRLKKQIQALVHRGKVDVYVGLDYITAKKTTVKVDKELAIAYYNAMLGLAEACSLPPDVRLQSIAGFNGVMNVETVEDDEELLSALLHQAAESALSGFCAMRQTEGEALLVDLCSHLDAVEAAREQIAGFAARVVADQHEKLHQRLSDILQSVEIDQGRLANELAFFADKVDISEELSRLASHISQFRNGLDSTEAVGRQLEFILQEMLREINTIGSKSNALDINKLVIAVKSELEKIREQIQNVE